MNIRVVVIALLLSFGCPTAMAQSGRSGTPQEQQACSRDASRLCRKVLGDDNSVQQCLQQNRGKLGSACRKVFESHGL